MNIKTIETQTTQVIKDMEHTNIVTFNTIEGEMARMVELNDEIMLLRPFSAYNFEITLDGEDVCLNPMNYNGNLKTIEYKMDWDTLEKCDFWLFYNHEKAIIYESITGEWLGEITKVHDPRNIQERIADMQKAGEI